MLGSSRVLARRWSRSRPRACGSTSARTSSAKTATSEAAPEINQATDVIRRRPTKAQFIAQADEIGKAAQSELAPLKARLEAPKGPSPSTYKAAASLIRENVAISRAVEKKLHALAQPPADAATIEKMLAGFSEEIPDKNYAANAIANEEAAGVTTPSTADNKAKAFDEGLAQGYGMTVCGRSE